MSSGPPAGGRGSEVSEIVERATTARAEQEGKVIRAIVRSSLRFRLLVVGVAVGVMAVGISQLRDAPVDVLPEFTPPYAEIQTEALGLSAEEVEQLITVPLEADLLNGVRAST